MLLSLQWKTELGFDPKSGGSQSRPLLEWSVSCSTWESSKDKDCYSSLHLYNLAGLVIEKCPKGVC